MELENGPTRIGFRKSGPFRGGGHSTADHVGFQKAAARQVFKIGSVEQPSVTPDVDALVSGAEPSAENTLRRRPKRPAQDGLVFERVFETE